MATIIRKSETLTDSNEIRAFLVSKGLVYESYKTPETLDLILGQKGLNDAEKEEVLSGLAYRFDQLKKDHGYKANDLVVLHDEVPGIQDMLAKFDKLHIHTDEEVRYIIDGSGVFGFIIDGEKFEVHVSKGDFISIPANTNHWFTLDKNLRIKAVRYFKDNSGWTPVYVDESKVLVNV
ncbi:cupin domain-containing protein [Leptospira noumeaensis]|uniref:Acireductone dioxygenase n=1 Tax=Leptospira noumeaensis TaxID=2484964 RepID=A0A4R9IHI5_9LEPT|nr:cupin domain-containing protein [Leptospira noumeaensis]TGK87067.1 cupin domain-containing protein [Leptospira noumeaensis]